MPTGFRHGTHDLEIFELKARCHRTSHERIVTGRLGCLPVASWNTVFVFAIPQQRLGQRRETRIALNQPQGCPFIEMPDLLSGDSMKYTEAAVR